LSGIDGRKKTNPSAGRDKILNYGISRRGYLNRKRVGGSGC